MKVGIEIIEGRGDFGPTFNLSLASKEGAEPFLTVRGCRMIDGSKGRFVSMPAKKLDSGTYWNHVRISEAFQDAVKDLYDAQVPKPAPKPSPKPAAKPATTPSLEDMDSDPLPF